MTQEVPTDLPEMICDHQRRYLESDGADGHMWDASPAGVDVVVPMLLLTTRGRKSGKTRILSLIYGEAGEAHVIVASRGGAPTRPARYLNLVAEPEVGVQVLADRFRARARTATGQERAELWEPMLDVWPPYADYQKRTEREIPVIVLERL